MVHLPHGVSEVSDNTWQLETKGVRSLGRDQRGEMIKFKAGDKRGERNDGGRLEWFRGISKSS
jgi:hypothetical protein